MEKSMRSEYKATPVRVIVNSRKRVDSDRVFLNERKWAQIVTIEDGYNEFRILPQKSPDPAYQPLTTSLLKIKTNKRDKEGKETGETELRYRRVFSALTHSLKTNHRDPIDLYIQYVRELANDSFSDTEEKKEFLKFLNGVRVGKTFEWGVIPSNEFVCYAIKKGTTDIVRLQLKRQWEQAMEKISMDESSSEDENSIVLDVFSDPEEGLPLIIEKLINDKGKISYEIRAKRPAKGQDWSDFFQQNRVSDQILKKLEELPSLKSLYYDSYTRKDFDMAIEGLRNFDIAHPEYNIFADSSFLSQLEEIRSMLPETIQQEEGEEKKTTTATAKKTTGANEIISPLKMKRELKKYIEENYPDRELPSDLSSEELSEWYKLSINFEELPFVNTEDTKSTTLDGEDDEPTVVSETEDLTDEKEEREEKLSNPQSGINDEVKKRIEELKARRAKALAQ